MIGIDVVVVGEGEGGYEAAKYVCPGGITP